MHIKMGNIKTIKNSQNEIYIWEWILLSVLFILLFISYNYWDLIITTRHSINFWSFLFNGDIRNFYHLNVNPPITNFMTSFAAYPFPLYIIFAIWDFPLWLLEITFKIDPFTSRLALFYAKSILIPFLIATCIVLYKICIHLNLEKYKAKLCIFLYLSSLFVLSAIGLSGQYDIISVMFSLYGVYYYLKGSDKKFVLFFAIAISAKLFAVFLFIPLLLMKKKKLLEIFYYGILGMSIYFISTLIFSPMPQEFKKQTLYMISFLFKNKIGIVLGEAPIFFILTIGFWIYVYIKDFQTNKDWMVIFICFTAYMIMFISAYTHPYWIILLAPFMCILMMKNLEYFKLNMLLETICSSFSILMYMLTQSWCYKVEYVNYSLLSKLFGTSNTPAYMENSLQYIVSKILKNEKLIGYLVPLFSAVFLVTIIAFMYVNYKIINNENNIPGFSSQIKLKNKGNIRAMIWARYAINLCIVFIPIFLYLIIKITGKG